MENITNKLPTTYWRYRRSMAIGCLIIGAIYALIVIGSYAFFDFKDFPLASFSAVFLLFLLIPIIIYMTGSNREDLEKIKGIIEVLKK